jgi:hypothetical protein
VGRAWLLGVDTTTLGLQPARDAARSVSGIGISSDGLRLYAAAPDRIDVFDVRTGQLVRSFSAPGAEGIEHVGTLNA